MDLITRRPNSIVDWLYTQNTDNYSWFEFDGEEVYANLVVADGYAKPTEQECIDGLTQMQADFDAKNYQRSRAAEYPAIADQIDMLWHAIDTDSLDKTSEFYTTLKTVKDNNPKPSE